MEPFSLAIGLGLSALGAVTNIFGSHQASEARQAEITAEQKAESIRNQAMHFDAMRKRREAIRQGIIARSQALTTSVAQGAEHGSALGGAFGTVAGQTNYALEGINQQEGFGQGIFEANQEKTQARMQLSDAQETSQIGSGISSLGGTILSNVRNIDRIGGYLGA